MLHTNKILYLLLVISLTACNETNQVKTEQSKQYCERDMMTINQFYNREYNYFEEDENGIYIVTD